MNSKNILQKIEMILAIIIVILIIATIVVFILTITKKQEKVVEDEQKVEYVTQLENMIEKEKDEILKVTIERESPTPEPEEEPLIPLDPMYNGFAVAGKITIPKTGVDIPFLDSVSVPGMEQAPCLLYKTGDINISGNTFIVGHNYMNGTLFSDNKNLEAGDKIIITAMDGSSKEYTIYDKFITTPEDTTYLKRETGDSPEITLQCCTDDDENRIIILAR